jgi:hypothetical protein
MGFTRSLPRGVQLALLPLTFVIMFAIPDNAPVIQQVLVCALLAGTYWLAVWHRVRHLRANVDDRHGARAPVEILSVVPLGLVVIGILLKSTRGSLIQWLAIAVATLASFELAVRSMASWIARVAATRHK